MNIILEWSILNDDGLMYSFNAGVFLVTKYFLLYLQILKHFLLQSTEQIFKESHSNERHTHTHKQRQRLTQVFLLKVETLSVCCFRSLYAGLSPQVCATFITWFFFVCFHVFGGRQRVDFCRPPLNFWLGFFFFYLSIHIPQAMLQGQKCGENRDELHATVHSHTQLVRNQYLVPLLALSQVHKWCFSSEGSNAPAV